MQENVDNTKKSGITRRFFMGWGLAIVIGMASLAFFLLTVLRMPFPFLLPGKSGRFKIGTMADLPPGRTKYFEDDQVYVFSDQDGIFAISAVCTHLGCIVSKDDNGFVCPCHGSRYNLEGKLEKGPAPKDLPWYSVSRLPNGQLIVDKKKSVKPGVKFI
ncbi:MAG: ubiquinol-cytochrome c reductase iron-sulfur subunit [Desulfobacterales bacterium]|nr:ubiquinol-cytochrome c reductase iron-sulfur subunit [Desulfobacterales bacterium]